MSNLNQFSAVEELDEVARALGWDIEYRQLGKGRFYAEFINLAIDGIQFASERFNNHLYIHCEPPAGFIGLFLPNIEAGHLEAYGHALTDGDLIAFPASSEMDFVTRSNVILQHLIGHSMTPPVLQDCVENAFDFPLELVPVSERVHALELFHGPSLAFKDFGARFLAQCLAAFNAGRRTTILTATSGDTGAAVALAFYGQPGIDVVVLYPRGGREHESLLRTIFFA